MSRFKEIMPEVLRKNPFQLIGKEWMLITAGNETKANTMTASWGGLGVMYGKNVVFVMVRPQRYTREFLDQEDTFSLTFFEKTHRKALNYLGSVSGRNEDKIGKSGLTLDYIDGTPFFTEGNNVIICKKLSVQQLSGDAMIDEKTNKTWYVNQDYHYMYIAEVVKVLKATN